jgi:hypothetical protein
MYIRKRGLDPHKFTSRGLQTQTLETPVEGWTTICLATEFQVNMGSI